jgi:RNA polymerase sigma factor (sigma-70 family)
MNRSQLIETHLKYARGVASKVTLRAPRSSEAWQDAFQAASLALVEAADAFDPSRGASFITLAWPRMLRAAQRLRIKEKARWDVETTALNRTVDGEGHELEAGTKAQFRAHLSASPEELLIAAESRAAGADRLARLGGKDREVVERVLDGRGPGEHVVLNAAKLAERAGLRVAASDRPVRKKLDPAESHRQRSRRWYARMSPEQREKRNADKRAAARRAREQRAAQRVGVAA